MKEIQFEIELIHWFVIALGKERLLDLTRHYRLFDTFGIDEDWFWTHIVKFKIGMMKVINTTHFVFLVICFYLNNQLRLETLNFNRTN